MQESIRSLVFRNYNKLRVMARIHPVLVDMKRLNKALGYALSPAKRDVREEAFEPDIDRCDCQDMAFYYGEKRRNELGMPYRGACKHILAQMMLVPEFDLATVPEHTEAAQVYVMQRGMYLHHPPAPDR